MVIGFLSAVVIFPFPQIYLAPILTGKVSFVGWICIACVYHFFLCCVPLGDDSVSLSADLRAFVPLFSHLCVKRAFLLEIVLSLCHMNPFWKARCQLPVLFVCRTDWGKCSFQLTSYLVGDISPESIVVYGVVPDQDVDPMISIPESLVTLPGFGPNVFSIDQLLDISCLVIGSSHVGSSSSVGVVPLEIGSPDRKHRRLLLPDQFKQFLHEIYQVGHRCASPLSLDHVALKPIDGCPSCVLFEEELDDACRFIARAEKINFYRTWAGSQVF
ncbi:unnamed protein product [Lactuca virosa]|uniref:Uncharacterized protein n=1 Tax=Lactuca virosa TaxID=75947 RepID=A0AAU9PDM4_9ASTR|nr:unnamed protein product [Lactuca virosa]